MFEVTAAFAFVPGVDCGQRVGIMRAAAPGYAHDGVATTASPHACASITRWHVVRRDEWAVPIWDQQRQILFAGDVRVYNRRELAEDLELSLDGQPVLSDLDLAFRAFLKWGKETPKHLVGDFAFIAWDERSRVLFAARDHTGMRPLHYRLMADGILLASKVASLLPFVDRPHERLNPSRILAWFFPPVPHAADTFFNDIQILPPGHALTATDRACEVTRYWVPPSPPPRPRSYRENCDQLLALFRQAVQDRLESDVPIVAHSSGGFDSSTILMAAREAYRENARRPPLIMASGLSAGFPCDDSRYMEAVAARVDFEWVTWNILDPVGDPEFREISLAEPGLRRGPAGGPRRDLEIAKERSARVLLEGMWGDEVLYAGGVFMDMFRHGRLREVFAEKKIRRKSLAQGARIMSEVILGALPPTTALWIQQRAFGRPRTRPAWLGPILEDLYPLPPLEFDLSSTSWPSHTMLSLWTRITGPHVAAVPDRAVAYGSPEGIEVRFPFADVRLIEHILSIPWDQRVPLGQLRRTGRDALGPLLPAAFAERRDQGPWTGVWAVNNRRQEPFIRSMLEEGPWSSAPYIRRSAAQELFQRAKSDGSDPQLWALILGFAGLESWLRAVSSYNVDREVPKCQIV